LSKEFLTNGSFRYYCQLASSYSFHFYGLYTSYIGQNKDYLCLEKLEWQLQIKNFFPFFSFVTNMKILFCYQSGTFAAAATFIQTDVYRTTLVMVMQLQFTVKLSRLKTLFKRSILVSKYCSVEVIFLCNNIEIYYKFQISYLVISLKHTAVWK
jgi:hypothetical protein